MVVLGAWCWFWVTHRETGTSVPFTLKAGFPPKPLEDPSITLKDAGLLNDNVRQELV